MIVCELGDGIKPIITLNNDDKINVSGKINNINIFNQYLDNLLLENSVFINNMFSETSFSLNKKL